MKAQDAAILFRAHAGRLTEYRQSSKTGVSHYGVARLR
jgi:hypothetical protein